MNIKAGATEAVVRELAAARGETVATAVCRAAEERLKHVQRSRAGRNLAAELVEIGRRRAALQDLDT